MVEVHWLTCCLREVPEHDEWLSPGERAALSELRFAKRRADWRLGRWTAKAALRAAWASNCDGASPPRTMEIAAADDGAPELVGVDDAGPAFSISHSGGVGLCAVTPLATRVGCDVEQLESRSDGLVRDFFTHAEQRAVREARPGQRALVANLIWSAKESALKALRIGLRADTRSVEVEWEQPASGSRWGVLTVAPAGAHPLAGWWTADQHAVLTIVTDPPAAAPIELSVAVPL